MKVSDHNKMVKYITDPRDRKSPEERAKITATQKANDAKRMAAKRKEYGLPDMQKHTINMLNKFENGPDIKEEDFYVQAIRNSPTPVPGYVGGATPDPTVPTRAERIAGQKQLEKLAVQPDSRGVFQKAVAADEAAYKKSQQYPNEATPEQVARLAYNMEKSRQMTGADGRYDKPKAIIKKKKVSIITSYPKIQFTTYEPFIAAAQTPLQMQQEQNFKKLLQEREAEKIKKKYAGIAGLIGSAE